MTSITQHIMLGSVAERMRTSFPRLRANQTVAEALASIRSQAPSEGVIVYFYVVDDDDRLLGVIPTRRLLLKPVDAKIGDLMVQKVLSLPPSATALEASRLFIQHRLLAFPVVDEGR